jgi:hypothetical protein
MLPATEFRAPSPAAALAGNLTTPVVPKANTPSVALLMDSVLPKVKSLPETVKSPAKVSRPVGSRVRPVV